MHRRLIDYTNLSSAVHGGPFSDLALIEVYKDKQKLETILTKYALDSFVLHKSLVESTYLFAFLMDVTIQKYYEEIKNIDIPLGVMEV